MATVETDAHDAQSTHRRFQRWLHHTRIHGARLYRPLMQGALARWADEHLYLSVDTSLLWQQYCNIRLSVIHRGRAVPVGWRVIRHRSSPVTVSAYPDLLKRVAEVLANGVTVILLADRASSTLNCANRCGKPWDGGIASDQRQLLVLTPITAESNGGTVTSILATLGCSEPVGCINGKRFGTGKRRWVDPHWFRGHSYFKLDWAWVKTALARDWPLFNPGRLITQRDPKPAMASRQQHAQRILRFEFTVRSRSYGMNRCVSQSGIRLQRVSRGGRANSQEIA